MRTSSRRRLPEQHDEATGGQVGGHPGRRQRVEEVVRGGLEGAAAPAEREVRPVPGRPLAVAAGEVLGLLAHARPAVGVGGEVAVERAGTAPLGADDHEVGGGPQPGQRTTEAHAGVGDAPLLLDRQPRPHHVGRREVHEASRRDDVAERHERGGGDPPAVVVSPLQGEGPEPGPAVVGLGRDHRAAAIEGQPVGVGVGVAQVDLVGARPAVDGDPEDLVAVDPTALALRLEVRQLSDEVVVRCGPLHVDVADQIRPRVLEQPALEHLDLAPHLLEVLAAGVDQRRARRVRRAAGSRGGRGRSARRGSWRGRLSPRPEAVDRSGGLGRLRIALGGSVQAELGHPRRLLGRTVADGHQQHGDDHQADADDGDGHHHRPPRSASPGSAVGILLGRRHHLGPRRGLGVALRPDPAGLLPLGPLGVVAQRPARRPVTSPLPGSSTRGGRADRRAHGPGPTAPALRGSAHTHDRPPTAPA